MLLSVQERDNWRRRMQLLEKSLREVRERRRRLELRLRRITAELAKLMDVSHAILDRSKTPANPGAVHASRSLQFAGR